jgi:DNA-binding LytR/AlgR family response regulator
MHHPKTITCLLADDEPPALDILKNYIGLIPALQLVAVCNNGIEVLNVLREKSVDLLFVDIQMPQLLGTDLIRTLNKPPKVIFTTAYRKFAIEGFELNAVDYLLKPISFERFVKAVNKVMDVSLASMNHPEVNKTEKIDNNSNFICFRADRKMHKVPLDEILYVESLKDYIKVVTSQKTIITKQSISSLEENLPRSAFVRIHRSYIVALNKIQSYTSETVAIGRDELPVSRMYRHEVDKILK